MRVEDRVIPARFLVTLGHLVSVLMVFKTKSDNVYAGLSYDPTVAEVAGAKDDVNVSGHSRITYHGGCHGPHMMGSSVQVVCHRRHDSLGVY